MADRKKNDTESVTISLSNKPVGFPSGDTPQLAAAREVALTNRRLKTHAKLTARLDQLNTLLGGMRSDQQERVGRYIMEQEERLRAKQNALTDTNIECIREMKSEIRALRDALQRALPSSRGATPSVVSSVAPSRPLR